jgi:hypothetical protein
MRKHKHPRYIAGAALVAEDRAQSRKLVWAAVPWKGQNPALMDILCYHAPVPGGYYRAAPVSYQGRGTARGAYVGYEAFFIPDGSKSAADVRDIAEELDSIEQAKEAAEADYKRLNAA